jgi:hypothetical protein
MLWPLKKDELQILIEESEKDIRQLRELNTQRETGMLEYAILQDQCELLAARLAGFQQTKTHSGNPNENLFTPWEARRQELERQLADSVRKRDDILKTVNLEIFNVRSRITTRNGTITSAISHWLVTIGNMIEAAISEGQNKAIVHKWGRRGWPWGLVEAGKANTVLADLKGFRSALGKMNQVSFSEVIDKATAAIEYVESLPGFDGPCTRLDSLIQRGGRQPEPAAAI